MLPQQADSINPTTLPTNVIQEPSLAPRDGDMLSLPFDQYGRMRIAQNIANALYTEIEAQREGHEGPRKLRVLDVGGYPGILRHFLSPDYYEVSVVDVVPDDGTIPGYTQGSGMELPFEDDSFDVLFSLDTLEHIPGQARERFLSEIKRVARLGAVLINPIQSIQADLAEETLDEYIRWILDAQQEQLAEHREFGLPDFAATEAAFTAEGWQTLTFNLANVYNWLFMMISKHYLISMRDERASAFERTLDRFYNLTFFESDRAEPAYRGALIAVRTGLEGVLTRVATDYPPVPDSDASNAVRLQLTEILMSLLNLKTANHEDLKLREQMERRDKHIAGMETRIALQDVELNQRSVEVESRALQIARLEEHVVNIQAAYTAEFASQKSYISRIEEDLKSKDEHIIYLEKLLQGIESGRVFRLTRTLSRFLGRH
ncbi:MAG: methyltransferase domain-containing protein [Chloroflexota bacterium]